VRPLAASLVFALLCLLTTAALAEPLPALRAADGDLVSPGDATWPLGQISVEGARLRIAVDEAQRTPENLPSFRVELTQPPGAKPGPLRACLGLASTERRNLYKTRAVEFRIKATRPVAGLMVITSSNTEHPKARDRFFGSFVVGEQWKTLRLPYSTLTALPGWPAEAARLGFEPGDLVLRPDSVEDLCIGAEAGRLPEGGVTLFIGAVRFVR